MACDLLPVFIVFIKDFKRSKLAQENKEESGVLRSQQTKEASLSLVAAHILEFFEHFEFFFNFEIF